MPEISLTDFVDFATATGKAKYNKLKAIKNRPNYEPAFDFYRQVRKGIVDCVRSGDPRSRLDVHVGIVTDTKKIGHYDKIVAGFNKWWGRKALTWSDPTRDSYSGAGVDIRVNPEIRVEFGGTDYLLKLYFKDKPLSKAKVDVILFLMEQALRPAVGPDVTMGILDTRASKLIVPTVSLPFLLRSHTRGEIVDTHLPPGQVYATPCSPARQEAHGTLPPPTLALSLPPQLKPPINRAQYTIITDHHY